MGMVSALNVNSGSHLRINKQVKETADKYIVMYSKNSIDGCCCHILKNIKRIKAVNNNNNNINFKIFISFIM